MNPLKLNIIVLTITRKWSFVEIQQRKENRNLLKIKPACLAIEILKCQYQYECQFQCQFEISFSICVPVLVYYLQHCAILHVDYYRKLKSLNYIKLEKCAKEKLGKF